MAHLAVGFLVLGLLSLTAAWTWFAVLMIVPVILSILVVRLRTVAERDTVTARGPLHSETVRWEDIDGLAFNRGSWARAQLKDGRELTLPAVTFSTLPQLTQASEGRVPNPYE
ncbi:PH domain-containing protein [Mycolicibacterium sp. 120270]|uniref:PH domain-containing protein n=1 Tax=Mycolicibacterium sp. 120270 TaxID=3090600 RepID=UPI00299DE72D|nr:PH domain-containing protein [Mycolicibacterium sp. 120270]MDX1884909.1 PH domain-containing protein [Mycolicibacterium sp. 120270]